MEVIKENKVRTLQSKTRWKASRAEQIKQRKALVSSKTDYSKIQRGKRNKKSKSKRVKKPYEKYGITSKTANIQIIGIQEGLENAKVVESIFTEHLPNLERYNYPCTGGRK